MPECGYSNCNFIGIFRKSEASLELVALLARKGSEASVVVMIE